MKLLAGIVSISVSLKGEKNDKKAVTSNNTIALIFTNRFCISDLLKIGSCCHCACEHSMEFAGVECMNAEADLPAALRRNGAKWDKFCACLHPHSVTDAQI